MWTFGTRGLLTWEMMKLVRNHMVEGLDIKRSSEVFDPIVCKSCIIGKQSREPFNKGNRVRSRRPLEVIHSDVCGQMTEETYDGFKYFVSFIDDFTHFVIIY